MWDNFLKAGYVKPIDLQLAKHLAGNNNSAIHAFIVHLSIVMRRGHVCVDPLQPIRPIWELIESEEDSSSISEIMWETMESLIQEGYRHLPEQLTQRPSEDLPVTLKPFVCHNNRVYTQRTWLAESQFRNHLARIQTSSPICNITPAQLKAKIELYGLDKILLPEQMSAILNAYAPISLIAGGPGTGKTYTAGWMISILSDLLEEILGRTPVIALAAPTGKAALHLESSVRKAERKSLKLSTGVTLHALLAKLPLIADLVVVDESSMIDLEWMNKLLKELPAGARLVLMGDPNQLPPVGMGSIFVDMIQTLPHTRLEKCLRTEILSIVEFANNIKAGNQVVWEPLHELKDEAQLISHCVTQYKKCVTAEDFAHFKLLTPFSKGRFGTEQLNQKILKALGNPDAIPILITKNDYDLELFNGELGLWIPTQRIVQFPKRSGEGTRDIPIALIGSHELGYCLTIHKSQGSEYPHVVIAYPEGAQIFGREALYTAVTRAKEQLELFSTPQVLQQTIATTNRRFSGLM